MSEKRQAATMREQAEFLDYLVSRCSMIDGKLAAEATITLTLSEAEELHKLAMRLHRIAPYENDIRYLVTGK